MSGASYNGAYGTQAGDLAKAAAAFMQGRRVDEEARRKAALDDALMRLREREAGQNDRRMGLDERKLTQDSDQFGQRLGLDTSKLGLERDEYTQRGQQFGDTMGFNRDKLGVDQSEGDKERQNRIDVARIGAKSRENVAGMRQVGSGRDFVTMQDSQGGFWRLNKVTNELTPIRVPTPADLQQGDTPQATGGQLLGAGARPSQGERDAAGTYSSFKTARNTLAKNMDAVGNEAPGMGTQFLLDTSKSTGFGPVSSVARSLSNSALGSHAPQYQLVQNSIDATGSMFVKLMTGAQMGEPEAQRLFNVIGPKAGDTKETVAQKMQQLDDIVHAQFVKIGRAAELDTAGQPPVSRSLDAPSDSTPPSSGKKYILPDGTVVE
jgi:hypothetical protein